MVLGTYHFKVSWFCHFLTDTTNVLTIFEFSYSSLILVVGVETICMYGKRHGALCTLMWFQHWDQSNLTPVLITWFGVFLLLTYSTYTYC